MEKLLVHEEAAETKAIDHALKDIKHAEKSETKAEKAADKAHHSHDKAVKAENKLAGKLNKAEHKHDQAVSALQSTGKDVNLKTQHTQQLEQEVGQRKAALAQLEQKKAHNDELRTAKRRSLTAEPAPAPAVNGAAHA